MRSAPTINTFGDQRRIGQSCGNLVPIKAKARKAWPLARRRVIFETDYSQCLQERIYTGSFGKELPSQQVLEQAMGQFRQEDRRINSCWCFIQRLHGVVDSARLFD